MGSELLLGVRLAPVEKMSVIKVSDVNLTEKVEKLRITAAEQTNLSNDSFDLIYCGCLLENDCTLKSYGLKDGSMVHVLKRRENKEVAKNNSTSMNNFEKNMKTLISVFQSCIGNPLLELAMRQLAKRPEVTENIISFCPDLSDDAVAIAVLQDPDLIIHFSNADTIKKIAKLHPALFEAAQHIASAIHDEAHNIAASSNALIRDENLSDDEEMAADSSQSSDSTQPSNNVNQPRNESNSVMNTDPVLAAITASLFNPNNVSNPDIGSSNSNNMGQITFEMFNQAMQQAFASNPATNNPTNPVQADPPTSGNLVLSLMHDMGLEDDALNIRALRITNGDIEAAVELLLCGFGVN
ncbi:PREDICTED: ubiquitin-like protein 7 [Ceratosolen solmsi marchali]|uniref:Ubiquitin-like protein 7 n=1 Tax=Ceratosolen solmsi marchali TaxID=326594 RepID=A0AAJ7DWK8_9HYME|nr:PREDICTED: ubiquitin-like protein 7 [Ceratosolen solmsi marchali]